MDAFMDNGGRQFISVVVTTFLSGIGVPPAISGAAGGAINGGARGAVVGAFTAMAYHGVGSYFKGAGQGSGGFLNTGLTGGQFASKVVAHGMIGGASSLLQGGKFGYGFASAGVTQFTSPAIDGIAQGNHDLSGIAARVMAAAIVGGTVSEALGGKFMNGAATGAFSRQFNDEMDARKTNKIKTYAEAEKLVDSIMTFEGKWGKHARDLAIDIARTPAGYDALSTGNAQEGIRVIARSHIDGSSATSYRNRIDIINLNISIHDFGEAVGGGYVALGGIRDLAHEIGHVAAGHFGGASNFQEQNTVDFYENKITNQLNYLPKYNTSWQLFGTRGDYFNTKQKVEKW